MGAEIQGGDGMSVGKRDESREVVGDDGWGWDRDDRESRRILGLKLGSGPC